MLGPVDVPDRDHRLDVEPARVDEQEPPLATVTTCEHVADRLEGGDVLIGAGALCGVADPSRPPCLTGWKMGKWSNF